MNSELIQKMYNHFTPDGCIMFSRSCDYYKENPISKNEIIEYYKFLQSIDDTKFPKRKNHIACCFYYLTKDNISINQEFSKQIIGNLSKRNDKINDENLILIYNIIDYDDKYLHSDSKKLTYLLSYLEKFAQFNKTLENCLLYKYYRGLILFNIGNINDAYNEFLDINTKIKENASQNNKYMLFILLRNDLLKLKMDYKTGVNPDELSVFLRNIYEEVKNYNKLLAVKIGFEICTNLFLQGKYNGCVEILKELKIILKNVISNNNLIDFYLAISSRMGLMGLLTNNSNAIDTSIEKLTKSLLVMRNDLNQQKVKLLFMAYTFALTVIKVDCNIEVDGIKKIAFSFKKNFLSNSNDPLVTTLISNNTKINSIINVAGFDNSDSQIINEMLNILNPQIKRIASGENINGNFLLTFIIGINNLINFYTEEYCKSTDKQKQEEYNNKCIFVLEKVFNYIKNNAHNEPLLRTELVKSAIIRIYSTYVQILLYKKNLDVVQSSLENFDDISNLIGINEYSPLLELILKVKGDFYFMKNNYNYAVDCYGDAITRMDEKSPKKPIIYFNLGLCYYYGQNINYARDCLNKCITLFRIVGQEKVTFEFYKRPGIIEKKIKIATCLLNEMNKRLNNKK